MEDLHISLSDRQQSFVEEQVLSGGYASASDYVAALIRAEEKAKAQARLEALLLEALDGEESEWTPALMDDIRKEARQNQR